MIYGGRKAEKAMGQIEQSSSSRRRYTTVQQHKPTRERNGNHAHPGTRRTILYWLASGRLFSGCVFLVSLGLLYYLFTSPAFHIQQVQVEGNNALKTEVVAELSQLRGTPIWFANLDHAAAHILENAYIEQVSIGITLPDRARIRVVERKPDLRWQLDGIHYLIDSNGTVLDVAHTAPEPGTLVIVDTTRHSIQLGMRVDADALKLARLLALRLPTELRFTPASIGWDFGLGVFVTSDSGQTIVFGQSDNLDHKLAIFHYLLNDNTAFTFLDLRPSNPYYQNVRTDTE